MLISVSNFISQYKERMIIHKININLWVHEGAQDFRDTIHLWGIFKHVISRHPSLKIVINNFIPKGKFAAESLHKNVYMTQHGCPHILVWPLGYTYLRNLFFIGENFVNKYEYLKEFWTSIGRLIKPSISNITFWGEYNVFRLQLHLNDVACVCKKRVVLIQMVTLGRVNCNSVITAATTIAYRRIFILFSLCQI